MDEQVNYNFVLKNGEEIKIEKEGYEGFIFAEGFTLKYSLKIKKDQIYFKNEMNKRVDFKSSDEFLKFIFSDLEGEKCELEELKNNVLYKEAFEKIKSISAIKKIETQFIYIDFNEDEFEFMNQCDEVIEFNKFTGTF